MRAPRGALRRHRDFVKLWAGQTVSSFGSGITGNGLPLVALLTLGATPGQMGLLMAAASAPAVLVGLVAGVWVDRLRRRPLMIAADLARALLIASIPAAALLGRLGLAQLLLVAALAGVLGVWFDVAYRAFLPDLVRREDLLAANSRLAAGEALQEIVIPGLTGLLVTLFTAPLTLLLDSASFLCSALSLALIRAPERPPALAATRQRLGRELAGGLRAVGADPLLRAFAGFDATRRFFGNFIGPLYALYVLRDLHLGPLLLGLSIGVGGASNLLGTLLVAPLTRRFGVGRTVVGALLLTSPTGLLIPLAHGPVPLAFGLLALAQAFDFIHPLYELNALSLRQAVTPPRLLGRVNATLRVMEAALMPLGAVIGGVLADRIGVRPTLVIAMLGCAFAIAWLLRSPLPALRALPTAGPEALMVGE